MRGEWWELCNQAYVGGPMDGRATNELGGGGGGGGESDGEPIQWMAQGC